MKQYCIALDAMGGDNAPDCVVEGARLFLAENPDIRIKLYGPEKLLREKMPEVPERCEIVDSPDVISMEDAPMLAVRRKTESSLVKAAMAVRNGEADALVSAGSTGAILACGLLRIGRIAGIERPALAVIYPAVKRPFLMLDAGANVDCQPQWLQQFGLMGSVYMSELFGIEKPDVRLMNIGLEETKGNKMSQEAYKIMNEQNVFHFGGNVESREMPTGTCDVVVCDGFDGNMIVKLTEGLASALFGAMKEEMMKTIAGKIGGALVKPSLRKFKNSLSSEQYGGAILLGTNGVIIKAHGNSTGLAIKNACRQAEKMLNGGVVEKIREGVAALTGNNE